MTKLTVIVALLFTVFSAFSQSLVGRAKVVDAFYAQTEQNAFLLKKNPQPDTTSVALSYKVQRGDLFSPISVSGIKGGTFTTSSFLKVSKWNLYGSFHYENLFSDKSNAILSAFHSEFSPIFLFQNKSTSSQVISYIFSTVASRNIFNKSMYLGLIFDYEGGSFYRKTDLRNTQNLLKIKTGLSLGKELNDTWTVGLDILVDWKKTKPTLSSIYQHGYDDTTYKHYMSIGFGTVDEKPGYSFDVKTFEPSAVFFVSNSTDKFEHQMHLKGAFSSCVWENKLIKDVLKFNKPYKYEQITFSADYLTKIKLSSGMLSSFFGVVFSKGDSYWQENNRINYLQAYWNKKMTMDYSLNYEKKTGFLRRAEIKTSMLIRSIRDKNYGNKLAYNKLHTTINTSFCLIPRSRLKPILTLGCEISRLLNIEKEEHASVSNNFMELIGNRLNDYWTSETLGGVVNIDFCPTRKKNLHIFLNSRYVKNRSDNFYKNTYFYESVIGMRLNY